MIRRFVNLVSENYKSGVYSLHRLDVSNHLFYASRAEAQAAAAAGKAAASTPAIRTLPRLPAPCTSFQPWPKGEWKITSPPTFAPLSPRSSEGRILYFSSEGHCLLYNADLRSVQPMHSLPGNKGVQPITFSVARPGSMEDDLYVLNSVSRRRRESSFDVLRLELDLQQDGMVHASHCHWECLPQPPFNGIIRSHTLVDDGQTICVSSPPGGFGTYCFDTVECEWRQTGYGILPFDGRAEFVPHLNMWLGFSPTRPYHLCTTPHLSSIEHVEPELQHVLPDLDIEKSWWPISLYLLNLGQGRFCVAKVFMVAGDASASDAEFDPYWYPVDHDFVVLTGVELVATGCDDGNEPDGLQIINHKSSRYTFIEDGIKLVL